MSLRSWLGDKLARLILGDAVDTPIELPPVDRLEDAPPDAPLLGSEAQSMLAPPSAAPASAPVLPPPLEGSVDERRRRLRGF